MTTVIRKPPLPGITGNVSIEVTVTLKANERQSGYRGTYDSFGRELARMNTRASATPVTLGMAISGEIDPGTDTDYFSIQVTSADMAGIDFLRGSALRAAHSHRKYRPMTNTMGYSLPIPA